MYICALYYYILITVTISFPIGFHLHAVALSKDVECILKAINKNAKTKNKRLEVLKQIHDFVDLHSDLKQLSHSSDWSSAGVVNKSNLKFHCRIISEFSHIYQFIVTAFFGVSFVTICAVMLMIQVEIVESFSLNNGSAHIQLNWSFQLNHIFLFF